MNGTGEHHLKEESKEGNEGAGGVWESQLLTSTQVS
jgi:hypothetical protein